MRRFHLLSLSLVLTIASLAAPARAQSSNHPFGLGLSFGEPSGFTGKYWFGANDAFQLTLGWRGSYYHAGFIYRDAGPIVTGDWTRKVIKIDPRGGDVRFAFYAGVGGVAGWVERGQCYVDVWGRQVCYSNTDVGLGLRVPLGFAAYFTRVNIEAYAEITPTLALVPFGPTMMGAIGGRFYF